MASRQILRSFFQKPKYPTTSLFALFKNAIPYRKASTATLPLQSEAVKALTLTQTSGITHITTLPNGVRVTTENTPGHFSAVGLYVDAGSRYETPRTTGVSHIVDRLAFKSTKTRTNEQIQIELESLGGNIMCASSREAIMYQAAIFPRDVPHLLEILADVIRNPLIRHDELAEQQQTALYELREIWQKPDMILPELLHTVAYKDNTLGNPMLCPEEKLESMTPELIREYIKAWYRPERIVIAAAGAPHELLVEMTEKYFGDMTKSLDFKSHVIKTSVLGSTTGNKPTSKSSLYKTITTAATSILNPNLPLPLAASTSAHATQKAHYTGGELYLEQSTLPHTHVYVAFEGLPIHDPDIYALATLQMLLGGGGSFSAGGPGKGMYTRLFTHVLNQYAWMESCMCFNHCYTDSGVFGIFASCRPEYNHAVADVIAQQFDYVSTQGRYAVTQQELNRAKNQLMSSLLMNLESRMVQLEDLGRQVQVHGFKVPVEVMCQKIKEVTLEDLLRVAERVFRGRVTNEGKGTGNVTIVAQGKLRGLADIKKISERYGLGRSPGRMWLV